MSKQDVIDLQIGTHIQPAGWMVNKRVQHVFDVLNQGDMRTLFVGGCVRRAVLGFLDVQDIDLATQYTPDQVIELCEAAGIKAVPTGIDHGTITVIYQDLAFEVTSLRSDVETDGRHARVRFSQSWEKDALRRDFTMNTLLMDIEGCVFDILYQGLNDLRAGCVRFVGEPAQRIQEDALRILRFFRFAVYYGKGNLDAAALKACSEYAGLISNLSKERISQEMVKLLNAPAPGGVLQSMFEAGVLTDLAFLDDFKHFNRFCLLQEFYNLKNFAGRLCGFAGGSNRALSSLYDRLIVPKAVQKDVKAIQIAIHSLPESREDYDLKAFLYHHGRGAAMQSALWHNAQTEVVTDADDAMLDYLMNRPVPVFPVKGADLMAQGYSSGPELGRELHRLEEEWIVAGFPEDYP